MSVRWLSVATPVAYVAYRRILSYPKNFSSFPSYPQELLFAALLRRVYTNHSYPSPPTSYSIETYITMQRQIIASFLGALLAVSCSAAIVCNSDNSAVVRITSFSLNALYLLVSRSTRKLQELLHFASLALAARRKTAALAVAQTSIIAKGPAASRDDLLLQFNPTQFRVVFNSELIPSCCVPANNTHADKLEAKSGGWTK
jgi:hypothetical protein